MYIQKSNYFIYFSCPLNYNSNSTFYANYYTKYNVGNVPDFSLRHVFKNEGLYQFLNK